MAFAQAVKGVVHKGVHILWMHVYMCVYTTPGFAAHPVRCEPSIQYASPRRMMLFPSIKGLSWQVRRRTATDLTDWTDRMTE